jgi:hypothetical protein
MQVPEEEEMLERELVKNVKERENEGSRNSILFLATDKISASYQSCSRKHSSSILSLLFLTSPFLRKKNSQYFLFAFVIHLESLRETFTRKSLRIHEKCLTPFDHQAFTLIISLFMIADCCVVE